MTTIVPGQRTAAGRPLRHDDHDPRRANQLRTGRWCPTAAMRPGRDSRWDVASNQYGAAGRGTWARRRTGRRPEMNETCDRCGPAIGAAYRVDRVGELYLCGQCASRHWRALSAQGWTFWPLGVHALAPQASAVAGYGPVGDAA
jgi:ribosomal protein S27AE